ncbi:MAG: hypothetical protein ABIE74_10320 [Pseudomonadota bacterium]
MKKIIILAGLVVAMFCPKPSAADFVVWDLQSILSDKSVVSIATGKLGEPVLMGNWGEISDSNQDVTLSVAFIDDWKNISLDLRDLVDKFSDEHIPEPLYGIVSSFPISAVAADENRFYAGTSGALLYSNDAGQTWHFLDLTPDISTKSNQQGTHTTCKRLKQRGIESDKAFQMISLNRICDLVILGTGRVLMAFDNGLVYNDHIDKHIADRTDPRFQWNGVPSNVANELFGRVVNDLAVNKKTIFAATDQGVWESLDDGTTWRIIGLDSENVYTLNIAPDGTLFAGSERGLYFYRDGQWKFLKAIKNINAIAVNGSTLFVGTDQGLLISYDSGTNFDLMTNVPAVYVIEFVEDGYYLGTSKGFWFLKKRTKAL